MSRPKRWEESSVADGYAEILLHSWKYYAEFINQQLLDYRTYIFRGHASDSWKLESTLDRQLKRLQVERRAAARTSHLDNFKYAVRGRRGSAPPKLEDDNHWWALGQHHGLATPLLDWTESPFVALYFAFEPEESGLGDHRAVWGISRASVSAKSSEVVRKHRDAVAATPGKTEPRPPICELVRPLTDENARLVSQRGLFVRGPDGTPIDVWMKEHCKDDDREWHLFKIRIPNKERYVCLRALNRMNINHLSLFPDLYGASRFCNMDLLIDKY